MLGPVFSPKYYLKKKIFRQIYPNTWFPQEAEINGLGEQQRGLVCT